PDEDVPERSGLILGPVQPRLSGLFVRWPPPVPRPAQKLGPQPLDDLVLWEAARPLPEESAVGVRGPGADRPADHKRLDHQEVFPEVVISKPSRAVGVEQPQQQRVRRPHFKAKDRRQTTRYSTFSKWQRDGTLRVEEDLVEGAVPLHPDQFG